MNLHILAFGAVVAFTGTLSTAASGLTVPSKPVLTQTADEAGVVLVRGGPGKGGNSGSGNTGSGTTGSGNTGSGGGKPGKGGGVDDGAGHNVGDDHGVHAPGHK